MLLGGSGEARIGCVFEPKYTEPLVFEGLLLHWWIACLFMGIFDTIQGHYRVTIAR